MLIDDSKKNHGLHEANLAYWKGAFDEKYDDTKRHFKMLSTALPIVKALNPKNILTIGDSRGRDAAYFKKYVGCHCTASDLDTSKLVCAKNDGFIDDCKVIDVEKIPFSDNFIDLIIVKESFHHWPRPMLGFYETLRVAKYGVIFIEPYDCYNFSGVKPYPETSHFKDQYEKVGNYKYQISLREVLKACWSLYMNRVLATGFNDPYKVPFNYDNWLIEKNKLDEMGRLGSRQFNLMTIFIEKMAMEIDGETLANYQTFTRPINPFLSDAPN
jgi:ubiquinone/menaquinone biosynthesis C-methylase UbiE